MENAGRELCSIRALALLDGPSATSEAVQCFGQFYDKTGT